ncbi:hypothetical protein D3C72_1848310 [compost metagenome]
MALTLRPTRLTSVAPSSSSSVRTRAAMAAGVRSSRRAASASDPLSITDTKLCTYRVSTVSPCFDVWLEPCQTTRILWIEPIKQQMFIGGFGARIKCCRRAAQVRRSRSFHTSRDHDDPCPHSRRFFSSPDAVR